MPAPFWTRQSLRSGREDVSIKVTAIISPRVVFNGNNEPVVFAYGPRSSDLFGGSPNNLKCKNQRQNI